MFPNGVKEIIKYIRIINGTLIIPIIKLHLAG